MLWLVSDVPHPDSLPSEGLQAIGPLRDFPPTVPDPAPSQPLLSDYVNAKIRTLCLLLSIMVVFNHAITWGDLRSWQGESILPPSSEEVASAPYEVAIEHWLSGSVGRITNPVFFAVSGYLFFWAWRPTWPSLIRKWRRRAFSLVLPLVLWGAWGRTLWMLDYLWINRQPLAVMGRRGTWGWFEAAQTWFGMNSPSQLWFITQLLWLMLIAAPVLALVLPRVRWWALPAITVFYFLPGPDPVWVFRKAALCFFSTGALLGAMAQPLTLGSVRWRRAGLTLWLGAATGYTILAMSAPVHLTLFFKVLVLLGIWGAWCAYDFLPERCHRVLGWIAPYRFFVYMGFDPLLPIMQKHWMSAFMGTQGGRVLSYFLFPTVVVGLCLFMAWSLHRLAPGLYFIGTGGRTPDAGNVRSRAGGNKPVRGGATP